MTPTAPVGTTSVVTLVVPPLPNMVRVGRLTASSLASLANMTVDDIDDVKIAVSEMITVLIQSGGRTNITLRFETGSDSFAVEASTPSDANAVSRNDLAMATAVLDAVADEHHISSTDDQLMMRIVKGVITRPSSAGN